MPDLREAFIDELKDLLDAEKQLLKALPRMAKAAKDGTLKEAFESHLEETAEHVARLEKVFKMMGETVRGKKCRGMEGLLEEGKELIEEEAGDAALICAAQKVEHYEIASYGSLVAWSRMLEESEAEELLEETLEEEKATDEKLTTIAESAANPEASDAEGDEDAEPSRVRGSSKARASRN